MDRLLRTVAVRLPLLALARVSGGRTIGGTTPRDSVPLPVDGDAMQRAPLGEGSAVVAADAAFAIVDPLPPDAGPSIPTSGWHAAERPIEGPPTPPVAGGRPVPRRARVREGDVVAAARDRPGHERTSRIDHPALKTGAGLGVVPFGPGETAGPGGRGGDARG